MTGAGPAPLVLYDGDCGLCDRSVRWIIRHDARGVLRFAPLQGETTRALRQTTAGIPETLESVVYLDGARVHLRSKAFLHLAWHLRWPWRIAYWFRWFPGFLGDLPYRLVAKNRHRLGKPDRCTLPDAAERARFLP